MSSKKRNNKFFRLKSHVWGEVKDKNLYDYRSKNFNALVRQIYDESGKKGVNRQTNFLIEKVERELFFKPIAFEKEITYFDLDRTIRSLQDSEVYGDYDLITDFDAEQFNIHVNLDNWKYEGSPLQTLVSEVDKERRKIGKQDTPKKHLKLVIDNDNRKIIIAKNDSGLLEPPTMGYIEEENKKEKNNAPAGKVRKIVEELNKNVKMLNQFKERKKELAKENTEIKRSNLPAAIKSKLIAERTKELESIRPRIKEYTALARELEEKKLKLKSNFIHGTKKRKHKRKVKVRKLKPRKTKTKKTVRKRGGNKKGNT